tara:strand:- start:50 stop:478 length:429 start_codon:yes stop_codon:yes gene_type:complete
MKTYSQFTQDLQEFKKAVQFMKKFKPIQKGLTGLGRAEYLQQTVKGKKPIDKISAAAGVARPLAILPAIAPSLFDQGKKGSFLDKASNFVADKTKNITKGRLSTNPKTDLGKKLGDKLSGILQRRNQNMGANELKSSTSGMG